MVKKLFLNIALVALVVFILDFAIGRTLRYFYFKEKSGLHFRSTYSFESENAEVLIFGSSRANHHYMPEAFEDSLKMSFYNTGRDGNAIFYQAALLKSVLKRYTPKVIILDYRGEFDKGRTDYDKMSALLPYYRSHPEIRKYILLRGRFEKVKLCSEIYPFNSQLLTISIGNLDLNKSRHPEKKGFLPLHSEQPAEMQVFTSVAGYEIDSIKVNTFREFITTSKNAGIKLYVVFSPIYMKFHRIEEIEICSSICKDEQVPFFDYSRDSFFLNNGQLFYDVNHLNIEGAEIFSRMIVHRIKKEITGSPQ